MKEILNSRKCKDILKNEMFFHFWLYHQNEFFRAFLANLFYS
jgi:hypothetical protein